MCWCVCIKHTQTDWLMAGKSLLPTPHSWGGGLLERVLFLFLHIFKPPSPAPYSTAWQEEAGSLLPMAQKIVRIPSPRLTQYKSDCYQGKQCLQEIFFQMRNQRPLCSFDRANSWPSDLFNSKSVPPQDFCLTSWEGILSLGVLTTWILPVSAFTSENDTFEKCTVVLYSVCPVYTETTHPQVWLALRQWVNSVKMQMIWWLCMNLRFHLLV